MRAFTKIFAIGTIYIQDIFKEEVEITEKVDGSQFGFSKDFMRSKGKQLFPEAPEKMFSHAIDHVMKVRDRLPEDIGIYCEYLQRPKHNVLEYGRIPKNNLMLFGVKRLSEDRFEPNMDEWADLLEIERVPILYKGMIDNPTFLLSLLDRESVLGKAQIEGVVVKNYHRPFLLGGQPIPIMAGKFVSEKFKEVAHTSPAAGGGAIGAFQTLRMSYRTEARWLKAIQHLREEEMLENSPRDIGNLIKEITMDIKDEEAEGIRTALYDLFIKDILRASVAGFPEFYKEYLLKQSLGGQ